MAIQEKLLKFKYHLIFGTIVSVLLLSLVLLAPRFVYVLAYFWPLFLSTAMFLAAAVLFGWVSPIEAEASEEKPGEGILDYVAGQPGQVEVDEEEPSKSDEGKQMGQLEAEQEEELSKASDEGKQMGELETEQEEEEEEEEPSKASDEGKQMGFESRVSDE